MLIFRRIFRSYWWQESDIWSQASYRYAILWEAFLDPSDSYFLFMGPKTLPTIWGTYMKVVTKYQISAINSCWEKYDEKCAYMFNVYRNQLSRQTGSRNLTGSKTLMLIFCRIFLSNYWWQKSDIWSQASYRYPISWEAFLDPSDSCFLFADFVDFYTHLTSIYVQCV
jgi:hypothetical protein